MSLRGVLTVARRSLKNVVAQFIGQLCLIHQATTKYSDEAISKRDASLSLGTRIATPSARNDNLVTSLGFRA